MQIEEKRVEDIVREVLRNLQGASSPVAPAPPAAPAAARAMAAAGTAMSLQNSALSCNDFNTLFDRSDLNNDPHLRRDK